MSALSLWLKSLTLSLILFSWPVLAAEPVIHQLSFVSLELAQTPAQRQRGLMQRTQLCADCGMLFQFAVADRHAFWMKNTPLSLDLIFLGPGRRIVTIHRAVPPNQEQPRYRPTEPVREVLEVPAGYAARHQLLVGDYLQLGHTN